MSSVGVNDMDFFFRWSGNVDIALLKVGRQSGRYLELSHVCGFSRGGGISQ